MMLRGAIGIGLLSGLLWGINNVLVARAGDIAGEAFFLPIVFASCNDLCAAATLLSITALRGKLWTMASNLRSAGGRRVVLAALVGGPFGQTMYFFAIAKAGAAPALLVTALYPIVGCLLARFFLHQGMTRRMWGGIVLSVAGAMLVCGGGGMAAHFPESFLWGIACALCAALAWGSEIVLAISGMKTVEPHEAVTLREGVSGLTLAAIVLCLPEARLAAGAFVLQSEALLLVAAGVAGGLSYAFWYRANNALGCARGTATNATYMIWGVVLGALLHGIDTLTASAVCGCALIFIGVAVVVWQQEEA
ncbi:DMT family transporter [uncultured Mitsuokella sp.]|uniref:DMT family transporter n=1 Tax=uncultured Mitsuokella sp. TaxID=453120 RepID=UPI00260BC31D|nr:DMT family transporter [uncultured Mitsuokella sp.]